MSIQATTLRPGLLVSLSTSIRGNVRYTKRTIEGDHRTDEGAERATWETQRVIYDPAEYEAAKKVRGKAQSMIRSICAQSAFGLLCPENKADDLDKAVKAARALADEFNDGSALTRIGVYVITGRIAADDVEAVRAINSELKLLLEDMERGVKNLDVKLIRDSASKARDVGQMLSDDAKERVAVAIEAARSAARKITSAGETAAVEIDQSAMRRIAQARTSFLDLDEDAKEIAQPAEQKRALDLAPKGEGDYELTYDGKGNFTATQVTHRKIDFS